LANRSRPLVSFRDHERLVSDLGGIGVAIRDRNHRCPTSLDLLDIAERLPGTLVVTSDDCEHRGFGRDERQRSVFEFARREPLGVFVADLLAFERTFERYCDVRPPADEKVGLAVGVLFDEYLGGRGVQDRLDIVRQISERLDERAEITRPVDQLLGE